MQELEALMEKLEKEELSCAVRRGGRVFASKERGIRPLVLWLHQEPEFLRGAWVADKVIGRAAALLLAYGGARGVYAAVLSESAVPVLEQYGIAYACKKRTPYIVNRAGDGMCPMEQRAAALETPAQAYETFRQVVLGTGAGKMESW